MTNKKCIRQHTHLGPYIEKEQWKVPARSQRFSTNGCFMVCEIESPILVQPEFPSPVQGSPRPCQCRHRPQFYSPAFQPLFRLFFVSISIPAWSFCHLYFGLLFICISRKIIWITFWYFIHLLLAAQLWAIATHILFFCLISDPQIRTDFARINIFGQTTSAP